MSIQVPIILKCSECDSSCTISAPLIGGASNALMINLEESNVPKGWKVNVNINPLQKITCTCPAHTKHIKIKIVPTPTNIP